MFNKRNEIYIEFSFWTAWPSWPSTIWRGTLRTWTCRADRTQGAHTANATSRKAFQTLLVQFKLFSSPVNIFPLNIFPSFFSAEAERNPNEAAKRIWAAEPWNRGKIPHQNLHRCDIWNTIRISVCCAHRVFFRYDQCSILTSGLPINTNDLLDIWTRVQLLCVGCHSEIT